jgi:hypothetical protein
MLISRSDSVTLYRRIRCWSHTGQCVYYCQGLEIPLTVGSHCECWTHYPEKDSPRAKGQMGKVPVCFTVHSVTEEGVRFSFDEGHIGYDDPESGAPIWTDVVPQSGVILIPARLFGEAWLPQGQGNDYRPERDVVAVAG